MTTTPFEFVREAHIPSLKISIQEFRHRRTGARHLHMATDDTNNAFVVAFRTIPRDSTGVAHILEHTTLCGSQRYPVRDPFFMMIRRSLNTFMNAFTANDWTAYPFASQNRKDFDNLLGVYLDAVFFPTLDPMDFAQEGHRLEFSTADDPDSDLVYKGVVYNEMKGAMSAPIQQLWQTLQSNLFRHNTYHYNSGGDPEAIPDLTYEQLKAFHAAHYHPSNAVFMTYGNFPIAEHQQRIEELALQRFDRQQLDLTIPTEPRLSTPTAVTAPYPVEADDEEAGKTHVVVGWLLGESANLREAMHAHLLSDVLLDNSASPLRKALETTDLGSAPSELCGLDSDLKEMVFVCGLEGSDPDKAEDAEALILNVLRDVAQNGVPTEQVEAMLHQLELSQREVGGGRTPYGLQLMVRALPATLHGADPVEALDIDPILTELRTQIQDPDFIKSLARRLLLDNPHRVRLSLYPDKNLNEQRERKVREKLANLKARLSPDEKKAIIDRAAALKARQERQDDPNVLPKVGIEDVPSDLKIPEGSQNAIHGMPATWYAQPTNGLVYQQIVVDLPDLEEELIDDLPLFCECLAEVGCGDLDYLQTQAWQAAVSGGVDARVSLRARTDDFQRSKGVFVLSGKALVRNGKALAELLREILSNARFDELPRLRELVAQIRAYREANVTGNGHVLAMTAATAGMGPVGQLNHRWSGLTAIQYVKKLDKAIADKSELAAFAERLIRIRDALLEAPRQLLAVGEDEQRAGLWQDLAETWHGATGIAAQRAPFLPSPVDATIRQGWSTNTQVNFCAKAYATVPLDHDDAPALMVLGPLLRNGFLHRMIREQGGAYGSGAGYHSDTGAFRFYSYRDPRLGDTLSAFDQSLAWLESEAQDPQLLEEAILNVISDIDRPDAPADEAIGTFFSTLHGRDPAQRRRFRQRILRVAMEDLRRAAERYLIPERASIAVVSNPSTLAQHPDLGLELHQL